MLNSFLRKAGQQKLSLLILQRLRLEIKESV